MKKLYYAAFTYLILGLIAGVFYREFTKINDFSGDTQLSITHTHLLTLGMLVFLVVLLLDRVFGLSGSRSFGAFFWFYNLGMVVSVTMMMIHGIMQVNGVEASAAISGIAGLGHILLSVGLILLFISPGSRVRALATDRGAHA